MIRRFLLGLESLLVAFDQLAHVMLALPKYVLFDGRQPDPDETISGRVGRGVIAGKRWAYAAEWIIDGLFRVITGERDHCCKTAEREALRRCDG